MIFSIVVGVIIGDIVDIDKRIIEFGKWFKKKSTKQKKACLKNFFKYNL